MTNEITTTEAKLPAIAEQMQDLGIDASDLVIPSLLLMQNTSEYVGDGKAKLGDLVNSQTLEVIGGVDKPVEFIPLKMYKTWRVYDVSSGQPVFLRQEPVTAANDNLPYEDKEGEMPIRRDKLMNFFVLLKKEVEAGEAFPMVISFKRTSFMAGKQLATHLFKQAMLGRPSFGTSMLLGVRREKRETNTYAVMEVTKGVVTNPDVHMASKTWLHRLSAMQYKVDEAEKTRQTETVQSHPSVTVDDKLGF